MKSMYEDVSYKNGILCIEFNPDMEENYTKLSLPIFFSFHKNGGLQLYKLLKSFAYNLPEIDLSITQEDLPGYAIYFDLTELKMVLGYIDISQEKLRKEGNKKKPDFEKMAREEINPQYRRWSDFSTRVITPGVKEVNEISDIYIADMKKKLTGKGGKVTGLTFFIQHNKNFYANKKSKKTGEHTKKSNSKSISANVEMYDFIDEIRNIISCDLKTKDFVAIAEAAEYNLEKVKTANEVMKKYPAKINNISGFLITAIQNGFTTSSITPEGKRNEKRMIHERKYTKQDYDDIKLLDEVMENKIKTIVISNKDRFIRFGYGWFEKFCEKFNTKIIIVNNETLSPNEELVQDIISILHVFSCRLYGLRKYKNQIREDEEIAKELQDGNKSNPGTDTKDK